MTNTPNIEALVCAGHYCKLFICVNTFILTLPLSVRYRHSYMHGHIDTRNTNTPGFTVVYLYTEIHSCIDTSANTHAGVLKHGCKPTLTRRDVHGHLVSSGGRYGIRGRHLEKLCGQQQR